MQYLILTTIALLGAVVLLGVPAYIRTTAITLPRWLLKSETGLGDLIRHITSVLGLRPCEACEKRAIILNAHIHFTHDESQEPLAPATHHMQNIAPAGGSMPSMPSQLKNSIIGQVMPSATIAKPPTRGGPPPGMIVGMDRWCTGFIQVTRRWYLDPTRGKVYYTRPLPAGFCNRARNTSSTANQPTSRCKHHRKKPPIFFRSNRSIPKDFGHIDVPPPAFISGFIGIIGIISVVTTGIVLPGSININGVLTSIGVLPRATSTPSLQAVPVLARETATTQPTATAALTRIPVLVQETPTASPVPPTPTATAIPFTAKVNYYHTTEQINPFKLNTISVTCPAGQYLVGGGFSDFTSAVASYPSGASTWSVVVFYSTSGIYTATAYAQCLQTNYPVQFTTVQQTAQSATNSYDIAAIASCPANSVLVGGGSSISPPYKSITSFAVSYAIPTLLKYQPFNNGWSTDYRIDYNQSSWQATSYAICAQQYLQPNTYATHSYTSAIGSLFVTGTSLCPQNTLLTAGGYSGDTDLANATSVQGKSVVNYPIAGTNIWSVQMNYVRDVSYSMTTYAVCVTP